MHIKQVTTNKDHKKFLQLPRRIYSNDSYWISHLDRDVEAVFDPEKNNLFKDGEAIRWIMENHKGNTIGRVAAFINRKTAYTHQQPTGGMGFFECINDKQAAFALFEKCQQWLSERNMQAMEGPINFGEKDRFWGLMLHNAGYKPPYLLNYNPAYYKDFFEEYGFKIFYEQYVYRTDKNTSLPNAFMTRYERFIQTDGYSFETLKKKNLDKYAQDFMIIYNEAWEGTHKHFKPMSKDDVFVLFKSMKRVLDPDIIIFVYYNKRPIAFFINLPELNQLFQFVDGKLNLIGKIKFLLNKWSGVCKTMYGMVFGIVPEFRGRGIESAMIIKLKEIIENQNKYNDTIIVWIGDFNPKMIRLIESMNFEKIFTLVTYKKLFDPNAKFERHSILP